MSTSTALEEEHRGAAKFGSTQSGIAPFYADKYLKIGIQVGELFDGERLRARLAPALQRTNVLREHLYGAAPLQLEPLVEEMLALGAQVRDLVVDSTALLQAALRDGKHILLEGQLGALRDPDHGIYPFSTSSSPLAGFAAVGAGVPAHAIERVVATAKAYSSCVGAGPFTTELSGPVRGRAARARRRRRRIRCQHRPPAPGRAGSTRSPPATAARCRGPPSWRSPCSTCSATSTPFRSAPPTRWTAGGWRRFR